VGVGANPTDIAEAVWDETLAIHTTAGTYGNELATKSDISAATSTTETIATSGSVIYGTEADGTYASAASRDNSYWEIDEHAVDGLTVELVYNLPDDDRAGVFKTFGRYEGVPSGTHYLELWAYNYESASFELIEEVFMEGGNTTDLEHTHEFFERHIDRTNNNEVTMRIVHNVTTYNATHDLYLDYATATSIAVITAEDIADAVWDRAMTDNVIAGTFGEGIWKMLGLMQENQYIDQRVYDGDNVTSARLRIYSVAGSVGTDSDVLATYTITATYDVITDKLDTYKVVKV